LNEPNYTDSVKSKTDTITERIKNLLKKWKKTGRFQIKAIDIAEEIEQRQTCEIWSSLEN